MTVDNDVMRVVGARTHNLKNVTVEIPRHSFVVITGKSGSGKSSLAIDTIFAEGQRQYLESLSLYSRQFFDQKSANDVDSIEGLQPTVCINQSRGKPNPRSTVATLTEIYDFIRLLYSKVGTIRCPDCGQPVMPQTLNQICDQVLGLPEKTKVIVLANMITGRKGRHADVIEMIRKERLVRVRVDGELHDIDSLPELESTKAHTIDAVTDRLIVREGIDDRLYESIELASKLSNGSVTISHNAVGREEWSELYFSTQRACAACETSCPELQARTFSFNSPYGACMDCEGLGHIESFDIDRIIPNRELSLDGGACLLWQPLSGAQKKKKLADLAPLLDKLDITIDSPLIDLNEPDWNRLIYSDTKTLPGILLLIEKEYATCIDEDRLDFLDSFRGRVQCNSCQGTRLNKYANSVLINDQSISEICNQSLADTSLYFDSLQFDGIEKEITEPIVQEIRNRLHFLLKVGLEYLSLNRASGSLSGGELQRVRLAKSIGSGLTGTCYVLDEPSVGLHQKDNQRLIETIKDLKDRGNSLIVVEHDESMIRSADHVIDIGPGAGALGGQIVAEGTSDELASFDDSLTGDYLSGRKTIEHGSSVDGGTDKSISIEGATGFNLKNINVKFPIGRLICVSGVSGSGKSTLIYRTLAPAIKQHFGLSTIAPEPFTSLTGLEAIEKLVQVDQHPISRTSRGCAATFTGVFQDIRKIFAATKTAKQRGYSSSRFSFNTKQGWCADCEGHGLKRIVMKLIPDVYVACESCGGRRFNSQTLSVRFKDASISDVLEMSVREALSHFSEFENITEKLSALENVGLGYLKLGQPSTTLSGGEAQRIKLATELAKKSTGKTLYLLDEPTSGLHFHDIQLLLNVLRALVDKGNTIIVIEHNLDVIRCADWVIDLGPDGGEKGGELIVVGSPHAIAACKSSHTGRCLAEII